MVQSSKSRRSGRTSPFAAARFVAGRQRRSIVVMSASAFFGGLAEALFLVVVTRAAFAVTDGDDRVGIIASRTLTVAQTLLLAFGLVVVRLCAAGVAAWQGARMSTSVVAELRQRLARSFLGAEWEVQQGQQGGSLQEMLTTHSNQASTLTMAVGAGFVASANLSAMLGLALAVDLVGALVMVVSVVALGLAFRPLRKLVRARAKDSASAGMAMATAVNDVAGLGVELRVFDVEDAAAEALAARIDAHRVANFKVQFANGVSSVVYAGLAYLALVLALAVAAWSSSANLTSLGAVMLVMLRSLGYGQALQAALVGVATASPAIDLLTERLDHFEERRQTDGGRSVDSIGTLSADRVTFAYPGEDAVLRDVSFDIAHREIIGIVGPSGGGKSTLVHLLLGLRSPQRGRILVDGVDIGDFDRSTWARSVTFVPQTPHFVSGTVAENIGFLRDDVTADDIVRAARLAHLHDDIVDFPEGYERQVGEQGGHLSGGQQQRLCIARALVGRPVLMILDEPTSALDVRSERLVRDTLLGLKDDMTVVVIAHRLSTLEICDRIMVLQDGELKAFDTPQNLEDGNDFYREALVLSGMR